MSEQYQKKELLELMATGGNRHCGAPSPQWASVSYGTFVCLECSGIHRGFGVHISFIRSITMDKWKDLERLKMKLGGNDKFQSFMENYGADGGYTKGMDIKEKYHSWAAAQYRDKLTAACADPPQEWSPSPRPADFQMPSRPASAQATRKSRAGAGAGIGSSLNPASRSVTPQPPAGSGNEAFFERMGNANSSRPADLPPSQGGKYAGFGSTYEPEPLHPAAYGTSSHAVPTLGELQANPLGALSKGWGLFSSAVATSAREINNTVVQPGVARAADLASTVGSSATTRSTAGGEHGQGQLDWQSYLNTGLQGAKAATTWAGQRANEGWSAANELAKEKGGVDLNEQLGKLGIAGGGGHGGRNGTGMGYGNLDRAEHGEQGGYKDDFFDEWDDAPGSGSHLGGGGGAAGSASGAGAAGGAKVQGQAAGRPRKDSWGKEDDEWKDF